MPSKPYWKDSKSWICPKHLPSVSIPGHIDKCWYAGCMSQRPEKEIDPFAHFDLSVIQETPATSDPTNKQKKKKKTTENPSVSQKTTESEVQHVSQTTIQDVSTKNDPSAKQNKKTKEQIKENTTDKIKEKTKEKTKEKPKEKTKENTIDKTVETSSTTKSETIEQDEMCAWFKCDKNNGKPSKARNQSKYCSRDCSNRNARHRMKQRQK